MLWTTIGLLTPGTTVSGRLLRFNVYVGGVLVPHTERSYEQDASITNTHLVYAIGAIVSPNGSQDVEIRHRVNDAANPLVALKREMTLFPSADQIEVSATGDATISSTTFAALLTATTPANGTYLCTFGTSGQGPAANEVEFRVVVGGVVVAHSLRHTETESSNDNRDEALGTLGVVVTPDGTEDVVIEWRRPSNPPTGTRTIHQRTLTLTPIPADFIKEASSVSDDTTSSTADLLITGMTITDPGVADWLVLFTGADFFGNIGTGDAEVTYSIRNAGVRVTDSERIHEHEESLDNVDLIVNAGGRVTVAGATDDLEMFWQNTSTGVPRTIHERTFVAIREAVGEVAEDASVRIALRGDNAEDASVRIKIHGEIANNASVNIALPGEQSNDTSVRIALREETSNDGSVRITINGEEAEDGSVLISIHGETADNVSVRIALREEISNDGSVRIKVHGQVATGTAAVGKLTLTSSPTAGETVTVDGKVYTYRTPLGIPATGTLTLTGTLKPSDGETVTVGGKVYTFQDILTDVDGNVATDIDADGSLDNLIEAIILGVGAGSKYAASMTINLQVTSAAGAGDTMDVTAKSQATPPGSGTGAAGNSIATTQTLATGSWGAATLSGGVDSVIDGELLAPGAVGASLAFLRAAINLELPINGRYSIPTTLHPTVSAAVVGPDELEVTAKAEGTAGNTITITETLADGSWDGATLSGGLDGASVNIKVHGEQTAGGSVRIELRGDEQEDASVRIALRRENSAGGSVNIALRGEDSEDGSVRIALQEDRQVDASVNIALPGETSNDGSVRIALRGEFSDDVSVRIALSEDRQVDASVLVSVHGEVFSAGSVNIQLNGRTPEDASVRVALREDRQVDASVRIQINQEISEDASVRIKIFGEKVADASVRIALSEDVQVVGSVQIRITAFVIPTPIPDERTLLFMARDERTLVWTISEGTI